MAKKVTLVYFSSTKTTKKNLLAMAEGMGCPFETVDFTLPASREQDVCFGEVDFVIFGSSSIRRRDATAGTGVS